MATSRGGIPARILMAAATLVVVGVFIVVLLSRKGESQKLHYANALVVAEYGLGEALMKLGENPGWKEGFANVPYKDGSYTVSLTTKERNDSLFLTVKSTGRSGSVRRSKSIVFRGEISAQGDTLWRQHAAH
ncbi:MAG: hypothetical protein GF418_02710 [Chitinivibrionales bacterium]|nr:hypothetical protein [Chitinivibrionales bacterium]MBD3394513.1 hypothetical protein [Chitinivibrionales bacterium]